MAFFRISLFSLIIRFLRRSRSFSWARLGSSFDTTAVSRCDVIHLFSVDIPTPRSSVTCLRVRPLVNAICTASLLNLSVRFSLVVLLLCCSKCYQRSGIKPRQVHSALTDDGVGELTDMIRSARIATKTWHKFLDVFVVDADLVSRIKAQSLR